MKKRQGFQDFNHQYYMMITPKLINSEFQTQFPYDPLYFYHLFISFYFLIHRY